MRRSVVIAVVIALGTALGGSGNCGSSTTATFAIEPEVALAGVRRMGVNLGTWTTWGAEQLMANVLKNPGFEGIIDRTMVIVKRADQRSFSDDSTWLGRPDGFWIGARYDIRTGRSSGQGGSIADSRQSGRDGLPQFMVDGEAPMLARGDVVTLTRVSDAELPTQWWIPEDSRGFVSTDGHERRPESPGVRALALTPTATRSAAIIVYLDAIGDRAGKLLPVTGRWQLSFWSRLAGGHGTLAVQFRRHGSRPFLSQVIAPTGEWTHTQQEFVGEDIGPAGILELEFRTSETDARILLDDVVLGPLQATPFPFRQEVVEVLSQLRPGYLRDWQGQLGDTWTNRLAEPFGRRASRYRPGGPEATDFGYSLPDFLDLCRRVGASPWIVAPTTFADEEWLALGRYLTKREATDRFEEILVEFGNENWNAVFRPAGIPEPGAHGQVTDRAFQKIREGARASLPLRMGSMANTPIPRMLCRSLPTLEAQT